MATTLVGDFPTTFSFCESPVSFGRGMGQSGTAGSSAGWAAGVRRIMRQARVGDAYRVGLANSLITVRSAQALRYEVFTLERGQGGGDGSFAGLDADPFDAICHHLVVEEVATGQVVGTYRLQTGAMAAGGLGYYSAGEFDLAPLEPLRDRVVELGRACVRMDHRNRVVLGLLWGGISRYARHHRCRYLMGCSSLPTEDVRAGARAYSDLMRRHLVAPPLRTKPLPGMACPLDEMAPASPPLPGLLRAYLSVGAQICGPPAVDRHFGCIDFLTLHDLAPEVDAEEMEKG
jgi:putative hemolysin